jgi:hypothetical protein
MGLDRLKQLKKLIAPLGKYQGKDFDNISSLAIIEIAKSFCFLYPSFHTLERG